MSGKRKTEEFGVSFTHVSAEEMLRGDTIRLAVLDWHRDSGMTLNWLPELFEGDVLSDKIRKMIVATLRLQADKLESKEMDARMAQIMHGASDEVH